MMDTDSETAGERQEERDRGRKSRKMTSITAPFSTICS